MEGLKHSAHDCELLYREENGEGEEEDDNCWGCSKPILGPSYRCPKCSYFRLHKSCAELPEQIQHHPVHPQHPLDMFHYREPGECSVCHGTYGSMDYNCFPCDFCVDLCCVQIAQTIQHPSHKHTLTIQYKKANFLCDACGVRHAEDGFSYQCSTCPFWVHEKCVSLPSNVKHTSHDHPLTLASPFVLDSEYLNMEIFETYCDICGKDVEIERHCFYNCAGCKFFAHVDCATSKIEPPIYKSESSNTEAEKHSTNLLCLPTRDESSSLHLVNQLLEQLSLQRSQNGSGREQYCFHDHQILTLLDNTEIDDVCDACVRPISAPYYNCSKCQLILHKSCAELPTEIHHPLHGHPLTLQKWDDLRCCACGYVYSGFTFHCDRCFAVHCPFNLDVRCASLPTAIRHEAHDKHALSLKMVESGGINFQSSSSRCSACLKSNPITELKTYMFKCTATSCNFNLHIQCALLPRTLTHRYDSHDLTLTYSPVGIASDEYYCELCEERLNMKTWFYFCADCDRAFHCDCVCKAVDEYANVKSAAVINVKGHPHSLFLAPTAQHKWTSCAFCLKGCKRVAYRCKECKFNLDVGCGQRRALGSINEWDRFKCI